MAGERRHVGARVAGQRLTGRAAAGDDVEYARRQAQLLVDEPYHQQCAERRDLGRLDHHRVARDERRRNLGHEQRDRKVPGGESRDNADGNPEQVNGLVGVVRLDDLSLDPPIPAGRVVGIVSREGQLAMRGLERLADLAGDALRERVGVLADDFCDPPTVAAPRRPAAVPSRVAPAGPPIKRIDF
jgi:hypothetical protein